MLDVYIHTDCNVVKHAFGQVTANLWPENAGYPSPRTRTNFCAICARSYAEQLRSPLFFQVMRGVCIKTAI